MKIDKTFTIKEKYFNAILSFEKPFELRHEEVEPNSIIKLECENGRYLIFKSGECLPLIGNNHFIVESEKYFSTDCDGDLSAVSYSFSKNEAEASFRGIYDYDTSVIVFNWYDNFCWEYINKAPTYLIEIAEILEVK